MSGSTDAIIGSGSTNTAISCKVHPFPSVIVKVIDPAGNPPAIGGLYEYPPVPPCVFADKVPLIPEHKGWLIVKSLVRTSGSPITKSLVMEHPSESTIFTVYVPGWRFEIV